MATKKLTITQAELIDISDDINQIAARMQRTACALELLGQRAGELLDLSPHQSDALHGLVYGMGDALHNDSGVLDLISRERLV